MIPLLGFDRSSYIVLPTLSAYTTWPPGRATSAHIHQVYHLVLILAGEGTMDHDCGRVALTQGDVLMISPGEKHIFRPRYGPIDNFAFNFYLIPWAPSTATSLPTDNTAALERQAQRRPFGDLTGLPVRDAHMLYDRRALTWDTLTERAHAFHASIEPYLDQIDPERHHRHAYIAQSTRFLIAALSILFPKHLLPWGQQPPQPPLLAQITEYLSAHIHEKYRLDNLARAVNRAPAYVCSYFKSQTGTTISSYLAEFKAREAARLLRDPTRPIGLIALDMGYSSQQHFCQAFRKQTRMSPSEFRRGLRV